MRAGDSRIPGAMINRFQAEPGRGEGFHTWMLRAAAAPALAIALLGHPLTRAGALDVRTGHQDHVSPRDGTEPRPGERESVLLTASSAWNYFDPQSARDYYNRASSSYKAKQYDRAISQLNRAIRLEPGASLPHSLRGAIWLEKKELDKAIADLNEAIQLDPQNA